jgi:hypothetical protein
MLLSEGQRVLVTDPVLAGVIGGTVHHLTVQFPNQRSLFVAIYALCLADAIFLVGNVQEVGFVSLNILDLLGKWVIFNSVYVLPMLERI